MKRPLAFIAAAMLLLPALQAHAADKIATDAELQTMLDQKLYTICLQQSARVLALKGDAAKPYNVFRIHMRRGECYLNLNDNATAVLAYNAALNAADNPADGDAARAMLVLLKASRGRSYFAKAAPNTPIDIVDPASRKKAMAALFTDIFAADGDDLKNAARATTLPPMIKSLPRAQEIHAVEVAATGTDAQTKSILQSMGQQARDLITSELDGANLALAAIEKRANQLIASGNSTVTGPNGALWFAADARMGLSTEDRNRLRAMLPYLADIAEVTANARQAAMTFGTDGKVWEPVIAQAQKTTLRAQAILAAE